MELSKLYAARFPEEDRATRDRIWQVLCREFFQAMIHEKDTVLDLGAGYGEFLRHIRCASRIAVELNPDAGRFLPKDARLIMQPSWKLTQIESGSVDAVLASNFFEHLPSKTRMLRTLEEMRRILRPGGRFLILQPNLAYLHGRFFDFFDHCLPLTHNSMAEALTITGFVIDRMIPRFLPFTTRSRMPQSPWLVRLYLKVPPAWMILGKQMFILAHRQAG